MPAAAMGTTDSVPVVSQVKSLVQLASGDEEGAKETQKNFVQTAPLVSQATSAIQAIEGDTEGAIETQKKFLKNVDQVSDSLPVVGHVKGAYYYATGDTERGEEALKSATGSSVSAVGGALGFAAGGPLGAAAGSKLASTAYDGVITGVDTALHGTEDDGSPRYYGSLATYDRIRKGEASAGEIFDEVGGTALDFLDLDLVKTKPRRGRKLTKGRELPDDIGEGIRCRRAVEYHLTSSEAEFVNSHQKLPGSVSDVLTTNWQHLTVPETLSNIVSLFMILRLILWNDKNGRTYSKELCSKIAADDYIEVCQNALMKTLRRMEDHFASQKENEAFVLNPDFVDLPGINTTSTKVMIRLVNRLHGILGSMERARKTGTKWLTQLCMYEDISNYRKCEEEILNKLQKLSGKAFDLWKDRKKRVKRASRRCRKGASDDTGDDSLEKLDDGLERGDDGLEKGDDSLEKGDDGLEREDDGLEKGDDSLEKGDDGLEKGDDGLEKGDDGLEKGDDGLEGGDDGLEKGDDGLEKGDDGLEKGDDGLKMKEKSKTGKKPKRIKAKPHVTDEKTANYELPALLKDKYKDIESENVGLHKDIQELNKKKFKESGTVYESNHGPAKSGFPEGTKEDYLPAHSLLKDIHQGNMVKVGTSKRSHVSKAIQEYQKELINKGKTSEALKLDLLASYGRSVAADDSSFQPALVKYRNDLHALINEHTKKHDKIDDKHRISSKEADDLHKYLNEQIEHWGDDKPTWDEWMDHLENQYEDLVKDNKLPDKKGLKVPEDKRKYG